MVSLSLENGNYSLRDLDLSIENRKSSVAHHKHSATHRDTAVVRAIISKCQEGDHDAFQELYRHFSRDVFTMALRMVNTPDIAEEVTQEVFISVYKNINRFEFQSAFTTWLYRIVMRRSADFFRKNKKHMDKAFTYLNANESDEAPVEIPDKTANPFEQAVEQQHAWIIEQAILSLNLKQRSILILRYVNHLSYEEIADVLECRVGTVKSRLNRAHKSLQKLLENALD